MAVPASVFQIVNIGAETTKGTSVAANKRVTGTQFAVRPNLETTQYRPSGYRWETVSALGKDWTQATLSGPVTYTEVCYWLESAFKQATPTGTADYTRIYDMSTTSANTTTAYTVEFGSSSRAWKFTYGQLDSFGMRMTRDAVEYANTTLIGQAIEDGITLTSSPTEIALTPVLPTQISLKIASSQAGLTGASALSDWASCEWSVQSILTPYWSLNASSSFGELVPAVPNGTVTLLAPANTAGMSELANIRTGSTRFLRAEAVGAVIGAGPATYKMTCDFALKFTEVQDMTDENGVFAIRYGAKLTHDSTWGKGISVTVVNEVATL